MATACEQGIRIDAAFLESEMEDIFQYAGEFNRAYVEMPALGRVVAESIGVIADDEVRATSHVMEAMRTLQREHPEITHLMWRVRPMWIQAENTLRMRVAFLGAGGQVRTALAKAEGAEYPRA